MRITASVRNRADSHAVAVATGGEARSLAIAPRDAGRGSAVNGGELLTLALATCYCNDLFREAARLGIALEEVEVEAEADFDGIGLAARNVVYRARVRSDAPPEQIERLLRETDGVAEIHNTLRAGATVTLLPWRAEGAGA